MILGLEFMVNLGDVMGLIAFGLIMSAVMILIVEGILWLWEWLKYKVCEIRRKMVY